MDKKRAVIYARVSSEKEMQLNAFENQLKWYDDLEEQLKNEYTFLEKRYVDKGITGTAAKKRPAFMQMIADSKKGVFDIIITREVARFARNTVESLTYTRELAARGIEVYFRNDNIHSMNPEDNLKLQLMSMIAEEESRKDSERARAGLYVARQNDDSVWGNGNIMGYDRPDGRKGAFVINEEQAETVIMIKDMYLYQDMNITGIKLMLEKLGRKTAEGKTKWHDSTVSRILDNPFYAGKQRLCQYGVNNYLEQKVIKLPKEAHIYKDTNAPTLYSWDEYLAIQEKKRRNSLHLADNREQGKKPVIYFWTKKLVCDCGSTYYGQKWRTLKSDEDVIGYRCNNQKLNRSKTVREKMGLSLDGACDIVSIPEWKLDMMAKMILQRVWTSRGADIEEAFMIIKECFRMQGAVDETEIILTNKQISKYKTRIENLKEMRMDGDISKEEFRKKLEECNENLKVLEQRKAKLSVDGAGDFDVDKQLEGIREALKEMVDFSKKRVDKDVLDRFIDLVYHVDNYTYQWFLKFTPDNDDIEVPEQYQIKITKKNTFTPEIIIKDSRKKLFDMVIDFEQARAYRKEYGDYLRANAWDDLYMDVYA